MADGINLTALKSPTAILPSKTTAGDIIVGTNVNDVIGTNTLSGVLTADTYKEIVSISTSGFLRYCAIYTNDATSRTLGLKIVIDGVDVFDFVSPAITSANEGFHAVGHMRGVNSSGAAFEYIRFNASISIQIKSSISETDKVTLKHLTVV